MLAGRVRRMLAVESVLSRSGQGEAERSESAWAQSGVLKTACHGMKRRPRWFFGDEPFSSPRF
jgi:hypothetical protein